MAAAGDNDSEATATAPKTTKSRTTKPQPVVKANVEPIKRATRKQTAKESKANSDVATKAATASVSNGKVEVKKRVRKGKVSQSDKEVEANEEPKDGESYGGSSPETPKVEAELPKTGSGKPKASQPKETLKKQEKKTVAKKGQAKAKLETATLNNGTEETKPKAKRGDKKVVFDDAASEVVKTSPSKVESTKIVPPKRGRRQKVEEEPEIAAASITAEMPKKRTRKGAKANTAGQNESDAEASKQVEKDVKAEPKKRARKAKA